MEAQETDKLIAYSKCDIMNLYKKKNKISCSGDSIQNEPELGSNTRALKFKLTKSNSNDFYERDFKNIPKSPKLVETVGRFCNKPLMSEKSSYLLRAKNGEFNKIKQTLKEVINTKQRAFHELSEPIQPEIIQSVADLEVGDNRKADMMACLNNFGQTIKLNSSEMNMPKRKCRYTPKTSQTKLKQSIDETREQIKKINLKNANSQLKESESNELKHCQSTMDILLKIMPEMIEKSEKTYANSTEMFKDLFANDTAITNFITKLQKHPPVEEKDDRYIALEEALANMEKDMKIEKQLYRYMLEQSAAKSEEYYYSNLTQTPPPTPPQTDTTCIDLEDTMQFVKEHLTSIKSDIKEFKDTCLKKLDTKVDRTEYVDNNDLIKGRIDRLERKLFSETKKLRLDIQALEHEVNNCPDDDDCSFSFRNFPLLPICIFLGTYTLVCYGKN